VEDAGGNKPAGGPRIASWPPALIPPPRSAGDSPARRPPAPADAHRRPPAARTGPPRAWPGAGRGSSPDGRARAGDWYTTARHDRAYKRVQPLLRVIAWLPLRWHWRRVAHRPPAGLGPWRGRGDRPRAPGAPSAAHAAIPCVHQPRPHPPGARAHPTDA